jgi:hypothetical protein
MSYVAYFDAPNPGEVGIDPSGRIIGGVTVFAAGPTAVESVSVRTMLQDASGNEYVLGPYSLSRDGTYDYWNDASDRVGGPLDYDFRLEATVTFAAWSRGASGVTIVTRLGLYIPVPVVSQWPRTAVKPRERELEKRFR